jgi:hypothetical protein
MKSTKCQNPRIRHFVEQYKRGIEFTNQGKEVQIDWASDYVDRQGLREWFVRGLHRSKTRKPVIYYLNCGFSCLKIKYVTIKVQTLKA